jgi:hypothetical protein
MDRVPYDAEQAWFLTPISNDTCPLLRAIEVGQMVLWSRYNWH